MKNNSIIVKIKIIFLMLFIPMTANAQIENISKFRTDKYENDLTIFKIKGKKYKTDFIKIFITDDTSIFENKTDDIVHFMVYNKKYLFVGFFPNTTEQKISSRGYEIRSLNKLTVIDLETPLNKWSYQFDGKTTMRLITSFNPNNGDIVYCNHIKPIQNK